jgi:hypothetical protein
MPSLNSSVTLRLLSPFGVTQFVFGLFHLADIPGRATRLSSNAGSAALARNFSRAAFLALAALFWRSTKSGFLNPLMRLGLAAAVGGQVYAWLSSRHTPVNHRRFDRPTGSYALPDAVIPSTQEWNDIRADMIVAKEFTALA